MPNKYMFWVFSNLTANVKKKLYLTYTEQAIFASNFRPSLNLTSLYVQHKNFV